MRETTKQNLSILAITLLLVVSAYIFLNFIKPGLAQRKRTFSPNSRSSS